MIASKWTSTFTGITCIACVTIASAQEPPDQPRPRRGFTFQNPVMDALDKDGDGALSIEEVDGAVDALLSLDADGDGNITREEMTPPEPPDGDGPEGGDGRDGRGGPPGRGGRRGGFRGPGGMSGGFGRLLPLMAALDLDLDDELFEDEVTDAVEHLLTLDADGNGALSEEELTPEMMRGGGPGGRGGGRGGGPGGRGGFPGGRGGDGEERGPVPRPEELDPQDAVATIPDRETFKAMSYQGPEVMIDTHLAGLEFVKIQLEARHSDDPRLYFMNTKTHRSHPGFMGTLGISGDGNTRMRGVIVYWPMLTSPSGNSGLYTLEFEPNDEYSVEEIQFAIDLIEAKSDLMRGNLGYNLMPRAKQRYEREKELWDNSGIMIFEESQRFDDIGFLPLHQAEGFGRLRLMRLDERPTARDVVIYPTLPNEMPRVAGIITGVQQTPLSHVNLRAVQDDVPNAFVANVLENRAITDLIGRNVYYRVSQDGFELREATQAEFESHFADLRPTTTQIPPRDLASQEIRPFSELGFDDASSIGVKAANLAALRTLGFREDLTPDGFAVPFSFYDEFMRHNDFYRYAERMQSSSRFQRDAEARAEALDDFQDLIKKGKMPNWMMDALASVQASFPRGTSIRCRSSTNNEDLPGFSGAGLYDSFTHHPDEGHLSKSIQQVFASLWNFRAYEEREFYRIDHAAAAMGVVLHPNSEGEQANGVAVTRDILYQTYETSGVRYYVNAQVGEDLVTNPESTSVPEEMLLSPRNPRTDRVIRRSSETIDAAPVLGDDHLKELRRCLRTIDKEFRALYDVDPQQDFAMEVEFKVEQNGQLFIKQARPWVF